MRHVRASSLFSVAAAVAFATLAAVPALAQGRPTITVAQAGDGFQFLTQQIAVKAGFFEKEGYDI